MYIKFCRSYGGDKKDEAGANLSPESKLSVELEGEKDKQTAGNTRLYRAVCGLLTVICLVLLLVVIILSVKLQTGSTVCPEIPGVSVCSPKQCQAHLPDIQPSYRSCQQCADGWLTFGQSCFFFSTLRLSWDESQKNCSSRGGSLAVINSVKLQNFLTKEGKMNYWIGLRQDRDKWNWVDNNRLQDSFWAEASQKGDCGILSSENPPEKNWITASCQSYTYYICQLQL